MYSRLPKIYLRERERKHEKQTNEIKKGGIGGERER